MKNIYKIALFIAIITVLILLVSKTVDLQEVRKLLIKFPKDTLISLLGLSLAISLLKAYRFYILLRRAKIKISFLQTMKSYIAGHTTTPLPGGETLRALLIHKETGTDIVRPAGPILALAYIDSMTTAFLA